SPNPTVFLLFLYASRHHPHPHSFPTRRSSDLVPRLPQAPALRLQQAAVFLVKLCEAHRELDGDRRAPRQILVFEKRGALLVAERDRKSTRLNSSHDQISYAVFCLKKKKKQEIN